MDDPRVLRIITVGLILAAMAVVYFLFTGGFSVNKTKVAQTQTTKATPTPLPIVSPTPISTPAVVGQILPTAQPSVASANDLGANRTQGNAQSLPNTGFPAGLAVIFSTSAIAAGFGLRRFPK